MNPCTDLFIGLYLQESLVQFMEFTYKLIVFIPQGLHLNKPESPGPKDVPCKI